MLRTLLQLTHAVSLQPPDLLLQHLPVHHVGVLQAVVPAHCPGHHLQAVRPLHGHGDERHVNAGADQTVVVAEQFIDLGGGGSLGGSGVPAASQEAGPEGGELGGGGDEKDSQLLVDAVRR